MFLDSEIAAKYIIGKAKLAYVLNSGIAAHLRSILISDIKSSSFFSISFEESLYDNFHMIMDIIKRF